MIRAANSTSSPERIDMITKEDRARFPHHTDGSILGRKLIGGLRDDAMQLWLDDPRASHPIFQALLTLMNAGGKTINTSWVGARLADEAYDRGLIDDCEYGRMTAC
jgi:hypothetical protein